MSSKVDRRQVRTKQLMYTALMTLIEEKGAEGVTVTDIANRANINRGTFYLHYRDVPDMLEQHKEEVFEKITEQISKLEITDSMQYASKDESYPVIVGIFEEIAKHAEFLRVLFGPNGDLAYAIRLKKLIANQIFEKMNRWQPLDEKMLIPRDYLTAYISSANFGIFIHWIESGMKQTPHEMGRIMAQLLYYGPVVSAGLRDKTSSKTESID
ncbi:TetR/AcrR family transcriptional regulator [Cohnella sp. WQ 127256]|uniref:TetR/AcrR family transcriptional regulator n=1 Tax=Cohnella sp. WQ 127256 TaxID=2938790 RepID=UPI0021185474|nr:TetR/AcrR family transcriptional regulator [Cohnella sp. WQ 127256]